MQTSSKVCNGLLGFKQVSTKFRALIEKPGERDSSSVKSVDIVVMIFNDASL